MRKHLIIVAVIAAVLSAVLAYLSLHVDFIPFPASVERHSIDSFVQILFAIASIFFSIIIVFMVYSLLFFRQQPGGAKDGRPIRGNAVLERAWTLIPLVIVLVLAAYGGIVLNRITQAGAPGSELEIDIIAQRFSWQFSYPAYNISSFELHVPVNQRIHLIMQSKDVIHSFWVQEWGPKQDIVPGMTTDVRYTPDKIGQYLVQCSQLCGYGHTYMTAPAFVSSAADFQAWITQQQQKSTSTVSPTNTMTMTNPQTTINLVARNIAFNLATITVPAGATITVNFDNQDNGVPHNLAVYTSPAATTLIFKGAVISGPATTTYTFQAPAQPGSYFFRCDVHPTQMTGTLVVQ